MLRSVLAVLCGYALFALAAVLMFRLSGHGAHDSATLLFTIVSTVVGVAAAFGAGASAGRLAPSRPVTHAAVVAAIIATGATMSLLAAPSSGTWSQLAALCLMTPAAVAGGFVVRRP